MSSCCKMGSVIADGEAQGGSLMLKTALCKQLGIEYPVFSAGIGGGATVELAAAVSNAGGCGVIGNGGLGSAYIREQAQRMRKLTNRPFGLNIILGDYDDPENFEVLATCIEERIPILVFFWGDARPLVAEAHRNGIKVVLQVGSVEEAKRAADGGVDVIIAQGSEAGGHVRGNTALSVLVPSIVDAVKPVPVIASGGIADGRGLAAALALGAQAGSLGTRFVASEEASAARASKERVVASSADDTVYSTYLFDIGWPDAPHRVIRNRVVREWEEAGQPPSGQRPGEGTVVGTRPVGNRILDVQRYATGTPTLGFEGDLELMPFWAGQSCGLVHDIKPAAQIVNDLVREAEAAIESLRELVGKGQPVA